MAIGRGADFQSSESRLPSSLTPASDQLQHLNFASLTHSGFRGVGELTSQSTHCRATSFQAGGVRGWRCTICDKTEERILACVRASYYYAVEMGCLSHTHTHPTCSRGAFGTISSTQVNMTPPHGASAGGRGGWCGGERTEALGYYEVKLFVPFDASGRGRLFSEPLI